ncbi:biotin/lipoyl-binding protein [Anaerocolumna sedimenticola]|uniref:Biotin/lipoyl-binding protein n=1 Tax=Anaerocolumna sedimenticola TaxID=2696063 RepID=A0A6P1TNZ6_9FIRM|nr:TolC family protein [Anaerocolumna sedimenticola]QHQ61902.1 biotin/lipoyl-binding protein [Anaerocolumna sedimenticola]
MNANKKFKIIGALFLAVLTLFLFLSKTIYSYHLPVVTGVSPSNGKLNKSETTTGLADWSEVEEIYSQIGGTIDEVLAKEGDKVKAGQELFRLSFNKDEINNKLKESEVNKNKILIDMEKIQLNKKETERKISALEEEIKKEEPEATNDLIKIKKQIEKLEDQIKQAEDDYEKAKLLYDGGVISKKELDSAESALKNLNYDLEILQGDYDNQKIKTEQTHDTYEKQLDEYKNNIEALKHDLEVFEQDLKSKELDLNNLNTEKESYIKALADFKENEVISAPKNATVLSIPVKTGQFINAGQLMVSFGVGTEYQLECEITLDNDFISVGDTCELSNASYELEGEVSKITPVENSKQVTVAFRSKEALKGETFEITFEKESTASYTLIPNGAINEDNDGYFIYEIKKRKGMLGDEFYAEKVYVYIGDSDNDNTVITDGLDFFEPVVLLSDKSFSDGETVKVENVGDFFEE